MKQRNSCISNSRSRKDTGNFLASLKTLFLCALVILTANALLGYQANSAEILGVETLNTTTGAWSESITPPAELFLGTHYKNQNHWRVPDYQVNGSGEYSSHDELVEQDARTFRSRLTGVAAVKTAWNHTSWLHVNYSYDVNIMIAADEDEYWEFGLVGYRFGAGSVTTNGNSGNKVSIGAATSNVEINHASTVPLEGDLDMGTAVVGSTAADLPMADAGIFHPTNGWTIISGTGPATVTASYSMPVSVGANGMIPHTWYRKEAAFRMGEASTIGVLGKYSGYISNGWYKQYGGSQGVRSDKDSDGLFLYGWFRDTDGDGIHPEEDNCPNDYNPGQEDGDVDGVGDICLAPLVGDGAEILGMRTRNLTTGAWGDGTGNDPDVERFLANYLDLNGWKALEWTPHSGAQWRSGVDELRTQFTPGLLGDFEARFTAMATAGTFLGGFSNISPRFAFEMDVMIGAAEDEYWELELTVLRNAMSATTDPAKSNVNIGGVVPTLRLNYVEVDPEASEDPEVNQANADLLNSITLEGRGDQSGDSPIDDQTKTGLIKGIGPRAITLRYDMVITTQTYGWMEGGFFTENDASFRMGMASTAWPLHLGYYPGVGDRDINIDGLYVSGDLKNTDPDGDGLPNNVDNCPDDPNAGQEDVDGDGVGDACDNCMDDYNPDQGNRDANNGVYADEIGDACDVCSGPLAVGTWEVTYDLSHPDGVTATASTGSLLNIRGTFLGLGDRSPGKIGGVTDGSWGYFSGPGGSGPDSNSRDAAGWSPSPAGTPSTLTLVFTDDPATGGIDPNGAVSLRDFALRQYFRAGASGTYVETHFDYTASGNSANGALDGDTILWGGDKLLRNYHSRGWSRCTGQFCTEAKMDQGVTYYKDFDMEYPDGRVGVPLNSFEFNQDLSIFTMAESEVANPPAPSEPPTSSNTFLYLRGVEIPGTRHYVPPSGEIDDIDGDGVPCEYEDRTPWDNCPGPDASHYNPDQNDINGDGLGDACQNDDEDHDGYPDDEDNCDELFNPDQLNSDPDEWGDVCDNCDLVDNPDQADINGDDQGDVCQRRDRDDDGWPNVEDNCGYDYNWDQHDEDWDGMGDVCDTDGFTICGDDDGDGVCNLPDQCTGDDASGDTDEDGICDDIDPCPLDDPDDSDGDGVCDTDDQCLGDDATGNTDASYGDLLCDDLDLCHGDDTLGNSDEAYGDTLCDDTDQCHGNEASGNDDGDLNCNDTDECTGDDSTGNSDAQYGDLICDDLDACEGNDASGDNDGDGAYCNDIDTCIGDNATGDTDEDGVCDSNDNCMGNDFTLDSDEDGFCDDVDQCPGLPDAEDLDSNDVGDCLQVCDLDDDIDGDDVCNAADVCPDADDNADIDGDGVCDSLDICDGDDATGDPDNNGVCADLDLCPTYAGNVLITYEISNTDLLSGSVATGSLLNIRNTPLGGLADRDPGPIGGDSDASWGFAGDEIGGWPEGWEPDQPGLPAIITLRFAVDQDGVIDSSAGPVIVEDYRMATYYQAGSAGTFVTTHLDTTGDRATGVLNGTTASFYSNLAPFHMNGWTHCAGSFCALSGMLDGVNNYKDFNMDDGSGVEGLFLSNFEFSADYSSFTMAEAEMPNPLAPTESAVEANTFLYLAGTQVGDAVLEPIAGGGVDSDGDGVCDAVDVCAGDDALGDVDGDLICGDLDPCPNYNPDDGTGNGVLDCLEEYCLVELTGIDQTNNEGGNGSIQIYAFMAIGQSFVPQYSQLAAIDSWIYDGNDSFPSLALTMVLHEGTIDGPILGTTQATPFDDESFYSGPVRFTFPSIIDVTPGQTYVYELQAQNARGMALRTGNLDDKYPAGNVFYTGDPSGGDLMFQTIYPVTTPTPGGDTDLDTVCDNEDQCPGEDDTLDLNGNGIPDCADTDPCADFGGDADSDGVCDDDDLCLGISAANNTDTNLDGIGDACQCGDVTRDGATNNDDVTQILMALWGYGSYTQADANWALCDLTGDGQCNNDDVTVNLMVLWGYEAYVDPSTRWICGEDSAPPPGL